MQPNFLIIGPQKSGTSSVYNVLKKHPDIYMPEKKELCFFNKDEHFSKGKEFYDAFFEQAPPNKLACGEATPEYFNYPNTPARIQHYLKSMKLIAIVRNPIERAYSQYWHHRRVLKEYRTFEEVVDVALTDTYKPGEIGYFSRGTYIKYIKRCLKYFHPTQLLVLIFDDLCNNPKYFYKQIFSFLNINTTFECTEMQRTFNPSSILNNFLYNWFFMHPYYIQYLQYLPRKAKRLLLLGKKKTFHYPPIDNKIKSELIHFYEPWNNKLSNYLDRDLSYWNK